MDLFTERVDDVPVILHLCKKLKIDEVLNHELPARNLQRLDYGNTVCAWIAYIISEASHTKYLVQDWVQNCLNALSCSLGKEVSPQDLTDDRLSQILTLLSDETYWERIEKGLWQAKMDVYSLDVPNIRLDGTTTYGYHEVTESGILQYGFSKDHRPDLPQIKVMTATQADNGHYFASMLASGNTNDDPLYLPMIERTRRMTGQRGLLYSGDCKMDAVAVRANIASGCDFYLMPMQGNGSEKAALIARLTHEAVYGSRSSTDLIFNDGELLGGGFETVRQQSAMIGDELFTWEERVLVVRSSSLADSQFQALRKKLDKAVGYISSLSGARGERKKIFRTELELRNTVEAYLIEQGLEQLIAFEVGEIEATREVNRGGTRNGKKRTGRFKIVDCRYVVTSVKIDEARVIERGPEFGWRAYLTNVPQARLSLPACTIFYRESWRSERQFHLLKDLPLNIQPLLVRSEDQIKGLIRLLTIALRVLNQIESATSSTTGKNTEPLRELYPGAPKKTSLNPTAQLILRGISRNRISLTRIKFGTHDAWQSTPLTDLTRNILNRLGIPVELYEAICAELNSRVDSEKLASCLG